MLLRNLIINFRRITLVIIIGCSFAFVKPALSQSLDPNNPAPLKSGINSATADSTVGTQYWYYMADPGMHTVTVNFQSMGVLGAPMQNTLAVTLSSNLGSECKNIISRDKQGSVSFSGKMLKTTKMVVKVDPLSPTGLIRQGGDYQIQVTGAVHFDSPGAVSEAGGAAGGAFGTGGASSSGAGKDAIIRTYMSMLNDWGLTKFLPDGSVSASDGTVGTWKLEDADSQAYTVLLGHDHLSLLLMPGRGLVSADSKDNIVFKQLR